MKIYTLKEYTDAIKLYKKESKGMLNTGGDGYRGWRDSSRRMSDGRTMRYRTL